jgi:hypothetical protein
MTFWDFPFLNMAISLDGQNKVYTLYSRPQLSEECGVGQTEVQSNWGCFP